MYCKGTTIKGKQCKNRCSRSSEYCHLHINQMKNVRKEREKKNENECVICFEKTIDGKCCDGGHFIHKECIVNSGKDECPLCRRKINPEFLSKTQINKLKTIGKKYKQEMEEESSRDFINTVRSTHHSFVSDIFRIFGNDESWIIDSIEVYFDE